LYSPLRLVSFHGQGESRAMGLQPLNQAFHERWLRLQNSSAALADFHRDLRAGELVAWLDQEDGKGLRKLERSYWQRAALQLKFDLEELPLVVVMIDDALQPGRRFYVSPAPDLHQSVAVAPVRRRKSHAGLRLLSAQQIENGWTHGHGLLNDNPRKWRQQQALAKEITAFLKLPDESWQTVEDQIAVPLLVERGFKKPRNKKRQKK
jgi:hypothetical protein